MGMFMEAWRNEMYVFLTLIPHPNKNNAKFTQNSSLHTLLQPYYTYRVYQCQSFQASQCNNLDP